MDNVSAQMLMQQIIKQAVYDYRNILYLRKKNPNAQMAEFCSLQNFFRSEWFYALSWGVNGNYLIEQLGGGGLTKMQLAKMNARVPKKVEPEEIRAIIDMHDNKGMSFKLIGKELDRSAGAVYNIYKRGKNPKICKPRNKYDDELINKAIHLKETTKRTWVDIADEVGIPANNLMATVSYRRRKAGTND